MIGTTSEIDQKERHVRELKEKKLDAQMSGRFYLTDIPAVLYSTGKTKMNKEQ
jgi:hypothetical protein